MTTSLLRVHGVGMRIAGLALGMSFALACGADAGTGACGEVPELVLKFEPGQLSRSHRPYQVDDQVTISVGSDPRGISIFTGERCGDGVPERLIGPELGLDSASILKTRAGEQWMGHRHQTGEILRLAPSVTPGQYDPHSIRTLDPDLGGYVGTTSLGGGLLLWEGARSGYYSLLPVIRPDSAPLALQFYPGPDGFAAPPAPLLDDLAWFGPIRGSDRLHALTLAGDLLEIHGIGDVELLQTGVRALAFSPDGTQMAWQAQGDGESEPIYLRTLATGIDVSLGVIEPDLFASGRWTADVLALVGPGPTVIRAHAREDGALLPPPPTHLEVLGYGEYNPGGDLLLLITVDAFVQLGLAWDPISGTVVEWYRGEPTEWYPDTYRVDAGLHYVVSTSLIYSETSQLWLNRLDGRPSELLVPDFNRFEAAPLSDGRIVMSLAPSFDQDSRVVLIDPTDGSRKLLADDVGTWGFNADQTEFLYTRIDGPDAGVWARPL